MGDGLLVVGKQAAVLHEPAPGALLDPLDQRRVLGADLSSKAMEPAIQSSESPGREEVVEEAAAAAGATGPSGPIERLSGPGWEWMRLRALSTMASTATTTAMMPTATPVSARH